MEISRELLFFISALGAFNGLGLGLYFLFFAKPKHTSHYFLGGLLCTLSVRIGKSVFFHFNDDLASFYVQLGLFACWFIGPMLYFYTRAATRNDHRLAKHSKIHFALLIPIALFVFIRFPRAAFHSLWVDYLIYFIYWQWFAYIAAAGVVLFQTGFLKKPTETKNKSFAFWVLSIFIGTLLIWIVFNTAEYTSYILGAISFSFLFYLLIILFLFSKNRSSLLLLSPPKYGKKEIPQTEAKELTAALEHLMQEDKLFKNANLSLGDVAKKLNILPHKLSQLLNEHLEKSFPNYLNEYRISEAKQLMKSNTLFSLEAIGYDCGFNSKSAFYAAFKKATGTTPSKFKEEV